ncbi:MAG TPA: chromosomal replication initiator protein DnaA [Candidatus Hydrogenedentes bacterium]|nr:chromosomal replication initiator protein DnaA [Candidatus Hydrogenedentota bacterium]HPG68919.1 chromosomal replication initiator protein DnaA [Candidatus Hydrogenedentota bacterium]
MPTQKTNPWAMAQPELRRALGEHSYRNWFSQTRYESFENGRLLVSVPSQFFADWLRDHYLDVVHESVRTVAPGLAEVAFIPIGDAPSQASPDPASVAHAVIRPVAPPARPAPPTPQAFDGFNPRYTFDRFVVGAGNRFAHAAARAVAENPARAYNPLFLYGGTGLGKTHLMQAIGQEVLSRWPDMKAMFISSEHFTNQLIESIARKSTSRFREKYRKVDVLLIDDIHFIAEKEATQEELFHTFNVLFDSHKQIVLSSDRGPKEIQGVEERLVSRFEWGLVTDIQVPDLETRIAILQNKALEEKHPVAPEVIRHIATHVTTNIRELEGALVTILAFSRLTGRELTMPMVDEVLRDLIGREAIRPVTIEEVQRAVAEHFDVRIADLRGRGRQRQIAFPRQIAMYLCKRMIQALSFNDIGEAFGGKDHSTVLYACQKITQDKEKDPTLRQALSQLERRIRS